MWTIEPGWVIAAFSALWVALGSVTWAFAQWMMSRLEKCETKHAEAHNESSQLSNHLAEMQGKVSVLEQLSGPALAANVATAVTASVISALGAQK